MSKARELAKATETLSVDGGTIKLDGNYPVGSGNVALGDTALDDGSLSGNYNTAVGSGSLTANTTSSFNTGIGSSAMGANTTGNYNTGVGANALRSNTTASNNTAVGYQALYANTTGIRNVALGNEALQSNTSGPYNVALGYQSGVNNTTGQQNSYLGDVSGRTNTTSSSNTYVGHAAGYSATGEKNTFVGTNAGDNVTSGAKNTIVGRYNGNQGGLDIRTSSNNIVLSDGDGNPRVRVDASGNVEMPSYIANNGATGSRFYNASVGRDVLELDSTSTGSVGLIHFYNPNGFLAAITTSGSSVQYNTTSDYRLKENVTELTGATDRLKQIPVYRFNFKNDPTETVDGFLAHEVQSVVPEAVTGEKDAIGSDGTPRWQGIDQSKLVPLLVATIKELEARITALEAK